ncbi:carboxyl-terminal processing protease [Methylomarinovum caldicuralii]|uniref:Carboxyl-terminal processing protease n=1 Tax=Methylomarinovum caldicuralii TaxID=438856 RepID=A0AAU9CRR5_9GAMM|nr:S41 family peptidase [Methylomarinovum caldicuralii]BCX82658.1 carboxyl-terminal processing protease [Methylomarinovum caldicuralii]
MRSTKSNLFLLALGTFLGILLGTCGSVLAERGARQADTIPFTELRTFTEVFSRIESDYVEPVEDKTLLENAIRGILSGLDPHSAYLGPDEYKELRIGTTGQFGGLGIEVGMENGFIKVISPIDDTPAQRAGIKAGDLIIRLDDKPVKGMTLQEAVKIMRGKPGTKITLTIVREGVDKPLKITLTRAIIKIKSVKHKLLQPGYGYVRITSFQSRTGEQLHKAIAELKKDGALKGLILDLRNNPGGVLNAAVAVSDAFLESGKIVYTDGRIEEAKMEFKATPGDLIKGVPMVVLINAGSASASEIVAGALQDHRRAIVMGQKSFGKGSVQTILPLSNGGAIKLTTARYYTPSGRSIQAEGIVPDIVLGIVRLEPVKEAEEFKPVTEASLSRHLENGAKKEAKEKDGRKESEALLRDYYLHEALNVLKGINIAREAGRR